MKETFYTFFIMFCLLIAILTLYAYPAHEKDTLKIGIHNFPASLNPLYAMDEVSQAIMNKVFDSLFYFDGAGKLQNGLVEAYHLDLKNKKIILTLMLKKKIFFSNGKELDADDVLATFKLIKDERFKSPYISKLKFINDIKKMDKYTLQVAFNSPLATWKSHLIVKILNGDEIAGIGPGNFRHKILTGTGPYRVHQVKEPSKVILKRKNPNKNPSMYTTIEYRVVSDTLMAPLKLISEELDICELQPQHKDAYSNLNEWQGKFNVLKYQKFGYTYLVFNLKNSRLTRDVRRIFYNLLIHGDFLDRFLKEKGERVFTPFLLLNNKVKIKKLSIRPLENPLRVRILANSESKLRKELILFLKNELKPFNIHISPLFLEYHTFLRHIKKSRFDMAVSGFLLDIDFDMKDIFYSDSYFNYAGFNHPEMDRLLDNGLQELDPAKREAIYLNAHNIWLEELPLIPLFSLYYYVGVSKKLKIPGTTSTLVGSESDFLFNIKQWTKK